MYNSILVIDNDIGVLNAFKKALPHWGFTVAGFDSISRGFEVLQKNKPQALILDIQLPKPQSISLLREAKKLYPTLPIIAITAYSTSFTEADAIREGADAYFIKPFDVNALVQKLKLMISKPMGFPVSNETMPARLKSYYKSPFRQRFSPLTGEEGTPGGFDDDLIGVVGAFDELK